MQAAHFVISNKLPVGTGMAGSLLFTAFAIRYVADRNPAVKLTSGMPHT